MKKIIPFILSLIVVMSFGTTTFAAENNNKISGQLNDYQEVLDKLNNEYGTNVHFASADEYEALGFESKAINVSPEEFESIIRKDIETNLKENNEAHIQAEKIASLKVNEAGSGICAKPNLNGSIKTSTSVTREKDVPGATVHLTATVNDTLGYWRYSSISSAWTTYVAGVNSTPAFVALSYDYSIIDSRRICALSLYGQTVGNYGVIIDSNAYRYVEFWAGSGM